MTTWGIVLAAGAGTRFGGAKQDARAGGVRLVDRAVAAAAAACDAVTVVLRPGLVWDGAPVAAAVPGGPTRAASVRAGLATVAARAEVVVVTDAAHPLAGPALYASAVEAVRGGAAAAFPGLPVTDALKRVAGTGVVATVAHRDLVLAQMPHAFRASVLRAAHAGEPDAVEDTALVERLGEPVAVVPGDPANIHVTTPEDLVVADRLAPPA